MEYRPNSVPDTPVSVRPGTLERTLADHYIIHRALVRWDRPRHPAFNTYSAGLRSFDKAWPRDSKPTAETLSAAWLFLLPFLCHSMLPQVLFPLRKLFSTPTFLSQRSCFNLSTHVSMTSLSAIRYQQHALPIRETWQPAPLSLSNSMSKILQICSPHCIQLVTSRSHT